MRYVSCIFLWGKVYAYELYFNYIRTNRYRDNKSPLDILRERFPDVDEGILNLPPIWLDRMDESLIAHGQESGYHVPIPALRRYETPELLGRIVV